MLLKLEVFDCCTLANVKLLKTVNWRCKRGTLKTKPEIVFNCEIDKAIA